MIKEQAAIVEKLNSREVEKVVLSLLHSRTGEVPAKSGLNWGQRKDVKRIKLILDALGV